MEHFGHRARSSNWTEAAFIFDYMSHKNLPQPSRAIRNGVFESIKKDFGFAGISRPQIRYFRRFFSLSNM